MATKLNFCIKLLLVCVLAVHSNSVYSNEIDDVKGECNQYVKIESLGQIVVEQKCGDNVQTVKIQTKTQEQNVWVLFLVVNLMYCGFGYFLLNTVLKQLCCKSTKR